MRFRRRRARTLRYDMRPRPPSPMRHWPVAAAVVAALGVAGLLFHLVTRH